jgi:poly-gamma-glutamate synthase PgsB/CapB
LNDPRARELLELGQSPYQRRLEAGMVEAVLADLAARPDVAPAEAGDPHRLVERVFAFLKEDVEVLSRTIRALRLRHEQFLRRHAHAATAEERRRHVLDYARDLGSTGRRLRADRRAFARWFDQGAVVDRFQRRHAEAERRMAFALGRLGPIGALLLRERGPAVGHAGLWERLGLEPLVRPLLGYAGSSAVTVAAFRCLSTALRALPQHMQEHSVEEGTLRFIYRSCLDREQQVWIQCEALTLLESLSLESLHKVLQQRLRQPGSGDDLFVRRRAVQLLGRNLRRLPELLPLLAVVAEDPSPFVRQALAQALREAPGEAARGLWHRLAREDGVPAVRAAALIEGSELLGREPQATAYARLLLAALEAEEDEFVLRVAVELAVTAATRLGAAHAEHPRLVAALERLHCGAGSLAVRRWAAQGLERLWCESDERARELLPALRHALAAVPPGASRRLPRGLLLGCDEAVVGRALSVLAQQDFGYDLERTYRGFVVTRGHRFRFRTWRLLHELRHPSPDKRQAFPHTIGRVAYGTLRAPSAILAELAETRVPGEPRMLPREQGFRPYLPLVDDVLSALNTSLVPGPTRFYTSEGVTELTPPASPLRRLKAYLSLTWSFARLARLRNWVEDGPGHPDAYAKALRRQGIGIGFRPHAGDAEAEDDSVRRFFPAILPPLGDELWQRFQDYFVAVYENSLFELIVFTALGLAFFLGRHLYLNLTLRAARRRRRLVVGGWGTRGKSGTERLKAALFNALGYSLVSKTTGCEAMFLHAHALGTMREMFLFRPYDKATIWEQRDLVRLADRLGADVLLWECMGLNPGYVRVLQRQWMRDDLSTLTNAYPDHEDIQGPAGINIPEVMTEFIPEGSQLITSEEQMRPILAEAARRRGTSLTGVGWLEAGLLTPDVLARFPYQEHPHNVALVLALARSLGADPDFALKEMADRVIPDLGMLVTTPAAPLRSRRLEFTNGMSANERHACLSNWTRLGFDRQDPEREPGVFITTVVNNRADRVARSRVFAGILVKDIGADRHFLVGGNLTGLLGYVAESWKEYAQDLTLWPRPESSNREALLELSAAARRLRLPADDAAVRRRLEACLRGVAAGRSGGAPDILPLEALWDRPDELRSALAEAAVDPALADAIVAFVRDGLRVREAHRALAERVARARPEERPTLDAAFRAQLWEWFQAKLIVVPDYHATRDQIVDRICAATPPGFRNRIMGIQNIKGTGLDFVYGWQAWSACHKACTLLRSPDPAQAERGLRLLSSFQDYGLLCEEYVRETLESVRGSALAQREGFQAGLALIASNLENAMPRVRDAVRRQSSSRGLLAALVDAAEALLDAGDAVARRKQANRIYADLAAERIGHERAALELQALNKRQHGGWLRRQIEALQSSSGLLGLAREERTRPGGTPAVPGRSGAGSLATPAGAP